jgi:antitoxin HicB
MLTYPIELTPDDNGTFLVTCPDLPEVTTFGDDEADAILRAGDALEEALAARIADRRNIPETSEAGARIVVSLPVQTAMKVALYNSMLEAGLRKADLARKLQAHGPQIDRLFDLRHASRLDQMEAAFNALGKRIDVRVVT